MTTMLAIKAHRYAGKLRTPGDKYDAAGQQERLVKALKWAVVAPTDVVVPELEAPKRAYMRKDISTSSEVSIPAPEATPVAESAEPVLSNSEESGSDEPRQKRAYRRRDLTAET